MPVIIYQDKNGEEIRRETRGVGRPPKQAEKVSPGVYKIVLWDHKPVEKEAESALQLEDSYLRALKLFYHPMKEQMRPAILPGFVIMQKLQAKGLLIQKPNEKKYRITDAGINLLNSKGMMK